MCSKCGGSSGNTEIPPPLTVAGVPPPAAPFCVSGKSYTTQPGATCESISAAHGVSSASLYIGNQDLVPDCGNADAGVSICIPLPCTTYMVVPSDTCGIIEKDSLSSLDLGLGLVWGSLRTYNSWIGLDCANLQPATEFYGKIICAGPQGGLFTGTAGIAIALFKAVNPSLAVDSCSLHLQPGTALCLGTTYVQVELDGGGGGHDFGAGHCCSHLRCGGAWEHRCWGDCES